MSYSLQILIPLLTHVDRDPEKATENDFTVEKIDLGVASRVVDAKHLESSIKSMISKTWKDEKDKWELKQVVT